MWKGEALIFLAVEVEVHYFRFWLPIVAAESFTLVNYCFLACFFFSTIVALYGVFWTLILSRLFDTPYAK